MKEIDILVRAIIQDKGKILVCQNVERKYYFFPCGHVEFGESAKKALVREIKEELGLKIKKCSFIGGSEHRFIEDGKKHHEINLAFEVKADKIKLKSREDHLQFFLKTKKELLEERVLPKVLTRAVLKRLKTPEGKPSASYGAGKPPFWASEI